jgi:enoyl-CoA hydratase/carnithine racemase
VIDYFVRDSVAFIRLNRPEKLNALTNEGISELAGALRRFDHDDNAVVGVLHGTGRAFSSGADVTQRLGAVADGTTDGRRLPNERPEILACDNWKPLIAAVHGHVIGHAFGTAMLCDLVVASEETTFQAPEAVIGTPGAPFWTQIAAAAGARFATDVILTGRGFSAAEAREFGLITRVVPTGEQLDAAIALAQQIAGHPQDALRETVRYHRGLLSEALLRATNVTGHFKWARSGQFHDAVRARLGSPGIPAS